MDRRWTVKSEEALARAQAMAADKAHRRVTTGHLLAALFEADNFVALYLQRLGSEPDRTLARIATFLADLPDEPEATPLDGESLPGGRGFAFEPGLPPPSADLIAALERAGRWAEDLDDEYVSAENLLLGLASGDDDIALTLQAAGVGRGGWQGVIRLRRELWERQVPARPTPPGFAPDVVTMLVAATHQARAAGAEVVPAHVLDSLVAGAAPVAELLAALGIDPAAVRHSAAEIAGRAVTAGVDVPVVSDGLHAAIRAARAVCDGAEVGPLCLLRGLARDRGEVGELLRGVDEMLAVLSDRVAEPASRLAGAVMAQRRAMQQSDLETAARLLHGEIPALEQEIEALGQAEAALVTLLGERAPAAAEEETPADDEWFLAALDTARNREVCRLLLRWLGDRDVPPGDTVELAAFCATVHDGPISGREAGRAAGRLALLGLVSRHGDAAREDAVALTAAGLRCLEDHGGDPQAMR